MRIVILDGDTLGPQLDLSPLEALGETAYYPATAPEEVSERLREADVALVNKLRLGPQNLAGNGRLKLICIAATGYDNIDTAWCREHGVAVCNVAGYSTDSVAQLTAAMALYLTEHLGSYTAAVRSGRYSRGTTANILSSVYHELRGMTWGVAGYGRIGRRVAEIAEVLGCRVLCWRAHPEPDDPFVPLEELCRQSDILSVHLPLNDATRGLFSRELIGLCKPSCLFINVARGAVADEAALAEALEEGRLGGLGIDVYSAEPFPETHPFYAIREREDVCFTPHMAWGGMETRQRCIREIGENIAAFLRGERRNRVD
ncbi:MAG: hydroxyacid dehydrogenase [Oscillospiraceae bacterium]|nr:hydroxyacid dehydrogenase [Oscillospiraceae bacterium]